MPQHTRAGCLRTVVRAAMLGAVATTIAASPAHAGQWMQTNCINPDGSPAASEGWSGYVRGNPSVGSTNRTACAPDSPMAARLSMESPAPTGAAQGLQYTPPEGSTLIGGTLFAGLAATGFGFNAAAVAAVYTPSDTHDASNVVFQCAVKWAPCQTYYGGIHLPPNRGGNLYLAARCMAMAPSPSQCSAGGSHGAWALVGLEWANLLLASSALPTAGEFRGSLLDAGAHGTAGLAFKAADSGPGIYKVIVTIDDKPVYNGTPNTNGGKCAPVGTDPASGALMWASQQPCPRSQTVDLTVRTTTLRDGPHELKVTIQNPARDVQTVLRQTITTNNRTTVSSTLTSDRTAAPIGRAAPAYAMVLDPPTDALVRGVRRGWTRSGLTLSGTLRSVAGVPAPGVLVTLFAQNAGGTAVQAVARATTNAAGRWTLVAPRGPSRTLTISYGEQPDPDSPQAIKIRQTVKPAVSLNVRALGRGRLRFTGRLRIEPLGSPRPLVVIQTRNGKRWQAVGSAMRVSKSGRYSVTYNGGPNVIGGSYVFRTVAHATSLFATGISPSRRTRVR